MQLGILTLIPPLVALFLALYTKNILLALFSGIAACSVLVNGANFLPPIFDSYILDGVSGNIDMFIYLIVFGSMLAAIKRGGGFEAFSRLADKRFDSPKKSKFLAWLLSSVVINQGFGTIGIGSIMRPVTDKHKISREKLAALLDRAGGLDFQLPVTLTDPAGGVLLTAGRQQLDGQTAAAVLGCSGWPGGEVQRCNVSAALLAAAVNTHLPLALGSRAEDFFARAVNGCTSTDLTARDYADHIEAARFMARLAVRPAQGLEVGGSHGPSGAFAADSSTLALLRTCFGPQDAAP